ncbi:serine hydrolase [Streptomyces mutabilis]|uniref:serine hydrolase n=1 Tax=Streptomyces mutabilis TaxID=67332 RepID=UPI003986BB18
MIVERVTGNPWEQEIHERIIEPLGLRHTLTLGTSAYVPQPTATACLQFPGRDDPTDTTLQVDGGADGGIVSTTTDMNTFLRALMDGTLLPTEQLEQMRTTVPAPDFSGAATRPATGSASPGVPSTAVTAVSGTTAVRPSAPSPSRPSPRTVTSPQPQPSSPPVSGTLSVLRRRTKRRARWSNGRCAGRRRRSVDVGRARSDVSWYSESREAVLPALPDTFLERRLAALSITSVTALLVHPERSRRGTGQANWLSTAFASTASSARPSPAQPSRARHPRAQIRPHCWWPGPHPPCGWARRPRTQLPTARWR